MAATKLHQIRTDPSRKCYRPRGHRAQHQGSLGNIGLRMQQPCRRYRDRQVVDRTSTAQGCLRTTNQHSSNNNNNGPDKALPHNPTNRRTVLMFPMHLYNRQHPSVPVVPISWEINLRPSLARA